MTEGYQLFATGHNKATLRLPIASELQGALADGVAEGLVGGEGVEPFGLRLALVSQDVKQTQGLTRSSQLRQGSGNSEFRIGRRATSRVVTANQSANCEL